MQIVPSPVTEKFRVLPEPSEVAVQRARLRRLHETRTDQSDRSPRQSVLFHPVVADRDPGHVEIYPGVSHQRIRSPAVVTAHTALVTCQRWTFPERLHHLRVIEHAVVGETQTTWAGIVGCHVVDRNDSRSASMSVAAYRRCPPSVLVCEIRPSFAQRATVFGDTPSILPT